MPADIFGGTMHDDVGTEFQRSQKNWCSKRRINSVNQVMFFGDLRHGFQISHFEKRIGWRLHPQHFCVGLNGGFYFLWFGSVNVGELQVIADENVIKVPGDTAINVIGTDHVISGFQQLQAAVHCRHTAGKTDTVFPTLDGSQVLF